MSLNLGLSLSVGWSLGVASDLRVRALVAAVLAVTGGAIATDHSRGVSGNLLGIGLVQVSNLAFAAGQVWYRRLRARHFADNPASGRVLRKLGFVPAGTGETVSAARTIAAASLSASTARQATTRRPAATAGRRFSPAPPMRASSSGRCGMSTPI